MEVDQEEPKEEEMMVDHDKLEEMRMEEVIGSIAKAATQEPASLEKPAEEEMRMEEVIGNTVKAATKELASLEKPTEEEMRMKEVISCSAKVATQEPTSLEEPTEEEIMNIMQEVDTVIQSLTFVNEEKRSEISEREMASDAVLK